MMLDGLTVIKMALIKVAPMATDEKRQRAAAAGGGACDAYSCGPTVENLHFLPPGLLRCNTNK